MNRVKAVATAFAVFLLPISPPSAVALGGDRCGDAWVECGTSEDGAFTGLMPREKVRNLPKFPGDSGATVLGDRDRHLPSYEYRSLADCYNASPESVTEMVTCAGALRSCPPDEVGPRLRIWRRTLLDGKVVQAWSLIGLTCAADVAPGARPTLTMADLKAAFMRTPWSKPHISTQPTGNTTLVNLRTFYKVDWTAAGFEPGEVDRSVLRGIPVQIRPKLVGFTYVFGDGATTGPTTSTGGVYPNGKITHTYQGKGAYPVHVDTTFGADFSLDGTTWEEIPSTVTVPGPATTVTVREAKSVLVNH